MNSTRIPYLVICSSLLLAILLGPTAAWAQRPELPPGLTKPFPVEPLPEPGFPKGKTVYVDALLGHDLPQCGTQLLPCRTINQGLKRARQIQDDPVAADEPAWTPEARLESGVTVEVGPGTYNESVLITARFIRLRGAGVGSSVITTGTTAFEPGWVPAMRVRSNPVFIEGFTFQGSTVGVLATNGAWVVIDNCQFVDNLQAVWVNESRARIWSSAFANNEYAAFANMNATMNLVDVTITGKGELFGAGVEASRGSDVQIASSQITNTEIGVFGWANSTVLLRRAQITGNTWGMFVDGNSYANVGRTTVSNNGIGILMNQGSFLQTYRGDVSGNDIGIFFIGLSHGLLTGGTTFSGNTSDTETSEGSTFIVR